MPDEIKVGLNIHPIGDAKRVLEIALELESPEEFLKERAFTVLDGEKSSGADQAVAN